MTSLERLSDAANVAARGLGRSILTTVGVGVLAFVAAVGYVLLWTRTTTVDVDPLSAGADVVVGLLWLTASAAVLVGKPGNRVGWLLLGAGVLWFAQAARLSNNGWLFTFGVGVAGGYLTVMLHLVLALPTGRLQGRTERLLTATTYSAAALLAVGKMFSTSVCDDYSPPCPRSQVSIPNFIHNPHMISATRQYVVGSLALITFCLLIERLRRCDPATRRTIVPVLGVGVVMVPTYIVAILLQQLGPPPLPELDYHIQLVYYIPVALLPVAVVGGMLWARMRRTGVGPLVLALHQGVGPDGLRDALARCLGDPSVVVAFADGAGGYVDGDGQPFRPSLTTARVSTPVELDGRTIALLEHHAALRDDQPLLDSAVAASRLALDNARLTAQVRAQLTELRASQRRLVTAVDTGRRQLERDLHDGAQQQLLGVAIDLARARNAAHARDHATMEKLLAVAGEHLDEAMTELRRLARGIHPPILTERGLPAAVEALASRASLPVEIHGTCPRLPAAIEATAYFVVAEALSNTTRHAHAHYLTVNLKQQNSVLIVEVRDDGRGGAVLGSVGGLQGLADRVAAEDGRFTVTSPPEGGTLVRADLPVSPTTDISSPQEK